MERVVGGLRVAWWWWGRVREGGQGYDLSSSILATNNAKANHFPPSSRRSPRYMQFSWRCSLPLPLKVSRELVISPKALSSHLQATSDIFPDISQLPSANLMRILSHSKLTSISFPRIRFGCLSVSQSQSFLFPPQPLSVRFRPLHTIPSDCAAFHLAVQGFSGSLCPHSS